MFASKKANSAVHSSTSLDNRKNSLFFQPRLNVGKPDDKYEAEADKIADIIIAKGNSLAVSSPFFSPSPFVQQQTEEEPEPDLQQKPLAENITAIGQNLPEEEEVQEKEDESEEVQAQPEDLVMQEKKESPVQEKPIAPLPVAEIQKKPEEVQEMEEEEEEPVQEKSFLQKSEEPDTGVEEEPLPVQAKNEGNIGDGQSIETQLSNSKEGGSPLDKNIQSQMESGFGTDFSSVRVHTDSNSVNMNKNLGAQAFAHGNDIYFNEGKYNPESGSGKHLLAHELTHTVQQGASVMPKMVQKLEGDEETQDNTVPQSGSNFDFTTDPPKIFIDNLLMPTFKANFMSATDNFRAREYSVGGRQNENDADQSGVWDAVNSAGTQQKLITGGLQPDQLYRISATITAGGITKSFERNGDAGLLAQHLKVPFWDEESGTKEIFEIDHKEELQLKGWPRNRTAGLINNLHLLSREANNASGNTIKTNVNTSVKDLINTDQSLKDALVSKGIDVRTVNDTLANRVKSRFDIHYRSFALASDPPNVKIWEKGKIESGDHIEKLLNRQKGRGSINFYDFQDPSPNPSLPFDPHPSNLDLANQIGSSSSYVLYWGDNLGSRSKIVWEDPNAITKSLSTNMFEPRLTMHGKFFNAELMEFNPLVTQGQKGYLRGKPFKFRNVDGTRSLLSLPEYFNWPVFKMPGTTYAGFLKSSDLKDFINNSGAEFELLSPFNINSIQIGPEGLIATGTLLPSVPFISRSNIEIIITEDDIRLQKVFSSGDLDMPSPFNISDVTLNLGYGIQNGFFIEGQVNFGINNVGEGHIGAAASTSGGFELEGAFNFDSEVFRPAEINVAYRENVWTIGGIIGIQEGMIDGVKRATINVGYENQTIFGSATDIELDVPGITANSISFSYGVNSGNFEFSISAGTTTIPGIQNAHVTVTLSSGGNGEDGAGSGDLALNISGSATFRSIPGLQNPTLTITYDSQSGVIDISGNLQFERGKVSGSATVGVTNRQVSDGIASGEAGEELHIYGDGQFSISITDEFTPQLGARLTPEGDILINGWVNVDLQIGEGYQRERTLFGIDVTPIPIFTIGIAQVLLTAGGSLGVYANINPISINGRVGFEDFNPATPESFQAIMEVTARASAEAGLKFDAYLGIMASAAIIYAEGSLAVKTSIGAEAGAEITGGATWSAAQGFEISNATANLDLNIRANASLVLHVGAGIYLYVSRVEVWSHDFPIASTDFPPLAQMQASMPVNFENGSLGPINADNIAITNNPLENQQAAGRFLQGAVSDVGAEPEEARVSERRSGILAEIRQYPSIGPANPDYYILNGKQFLVEELKNNNPDEDWSWLDQELANMEYSEFINFRAYILGQPCSSARTYEVQMFGIDHPSISSADMSILESELQEQEDECLLGADIPNEPDL